MNQTKQKKKRFRTVDLSYIALGAVLIAVCSWISIPTTVPFTMQTFGVFFVLSILGGRRGTAAIVVYVLLGAVGVPVFSQFTSGIGVLLGNTGGYLIGLCFFLMLWYSLNGFSISSRIMIKQVDSARDMACRKECLCTLRRK